MPLKVKIRKLNPKATIPTYARPGDAGLDMYSLEDYILQPNERKIFPTGFALEFPEGYVAIVKDRGSMAGKGIHTMGGVFDAGYRGEYNVQLVNLGPEPYEIKTGHKIAQLIIYPIAVAELEETENLSETARGDGRMGSTGM